MQPLACTTHVCSPAPPHFVLPLVHALVQHEADPAGPVHAPFVQVPVEDVYQQPCASWAHAAIVEEFAHAVPAPLQFASALHVQDADPTAPVQAWCVPQATPPFQAVHPLACIWQVCTPAPPHLVVPLVHALVQHEAEPGLPEQAPPVHVEVADAYQQPCASWAHVASVVPLAHDGPALPAMEQIGSVTTQVHTAAPALPPPVQLWCAPHAVAMPQAPVVSHFCGPLAEHLVSPGVHTPWHAPPTHAWFTHGAGMPKCPVVSHF